MLTTNDNDDNGKSLTDDWSTGSRSQTDKLFWHRASVRAADTLHKLEEDVKFLRWRKQVILQIQRSCERCDIAFFMWVALTNYKLSIAAFTHGIIIYVSGNFSISHSTQRTIDDEQHTTMSNCQFTALFMLSIVSILRVHVQWSVKLVENVNIYIFFVQHKAPRRLSTMSHVCKRRREVHKSIKLLSDLVVVSSVWSTKTTIWKRK